MRLLPIGLFCVAVIAFLNTSLNAFESEIKLTGRKDIVLSIEKRQTVLDVGAAILSNQTDDSLPDFNELNNPFTFEVSTPTEPAGNTNTEEVAKPEPVTYTDADVLALSSTSFAKKVRGSIVRGDSSFLQLEGGVLLRPGTGFPVRLPGANDQVFRLTITEITSEGYTLQVGDATAQRTFGSKAQPDSIKFSNP